MEIFTYRILLLETESDGIAKVKKLIQINL